MIKEEVVMSLGGYGGTGEVGLLRKRAEVL